MPVIKRNIYAGFLMMKISRSTTEQPSEP